MTGANHQILLQTKLYRPRVTSDLVHRARLTKVLNYGLDRSLILVAAPAGFGKSTLLSAWLETQEMPHAWISLDEDDNDLGVFLSYFVAAVQALFPAALPETQAFLRGFSLPPVSVIANSLLNELDELQRDFILVLDDYQVIRDPSIPELLNLLLRHPPQGMHLAIATRLDPQLALGLLRARNQVAEIRGQDLRFTGAEIAVFAEQALQTPLNHEALTVLAEKTEGWAAGLRFAALALRYSEDVESHLATLQAENRYAIDYLMREVLSQQVPATRDFMLKTSILDQVCGPLGAAVLGPKYSDSQPQESLIWLAQANLFTVALDTRNLWYRYHHIFRELLRDELARQTSAHEIAGLHLRASEWFAQQGLLEPALHHALQGNDVPAAVRLLAEHRHALMDAEQWQLLERTLRMFPAQTITQYPDLLLIKAWLTELNRSDPQYVREAVDRAAALIAQPENQTVHGTHLSGEIDTLRAMAGYMAADDPEHVVTLARRALATTPRTRYLVRAVAWLRLAVTYQLLGRLDQAYTALAEGAPEDVSPDGAVRARIAGSRCFVEWMAGDLPAIAQGASHLVAVGKKHQRLESLGWGHYFLAGTAYQRNDLATAEKHAQAGEEIRYTGRSMTYLQSAFIYASICQARGQPDHAQQKLDLAFEFLNETGSEGLMPLAQAFQAELALRKGDPGAARHWATTAGPFLPFTALPYYYAPQLTLPKFLLALDTSGSRRQAAEVLSRLRSFVTSIHNTPFTIEVLALQALLHDAQGDRTAALALLQQAVALAEPGGFIRLFVDLGSRLANLLAQLRRAGVAAGYVDQILPAFNEPAVTVPHPNTAVPVDRHMELVEPLTNRELEVLVLLAQRLSNKEIAQLLVISTQTVKRHASNIYQKLQVDGRRAAVVEATRLGLL